jgi:hypothetical protein
MPCLRSDNASFTILREPLERMISEYAFLRDRPHFMDRLDPRATSLRDYLLHPQTSVYSLGIARPIRPQQFVPLLLHDDCVSKAMHTCI